MKGASMMYSASIETLKDIVEWLRSQDESLWGDQVGLLSETIGELSGMGQSKSRRDKTGSRSMEPDFLPPGAAEINAAMPHLERMLAAMQIRNRKEALDYGQSALRLLPT
jgi:hypothetical protein